MARFSFSYRESSEGAASTSSPGGNSLAPYLADAIESPNHALTPGGPPLTCFYDRKCMDDGEEWHGLAAVLHGLSASSLVMPLVSRGVIESFKLANKRRDATLHEWEVTLDRLRAGECLCLPVMVGDVSVAADDMPVTAHCASGVCIRDTVSYILSLPVVAVGIGADGLPVAEDLARVGATAADMLRTYTKQRERLGDKLYLLDQYFAREWGRLKRLLDQGDIIGRGGYSTVYRGVLGQSGVEVAVKALYVSTAEAHSMKQFNAESEIMMRLDHAVRWPFQLAA